MGNRMMLKDYPDVLNVTQVAEILDVGEKSVYKLIHQNILGSVKIGKTYRIPKTALIQFLDSAKYSVIEFE